MNEGAIAVLTLVFAGGSLIAAWKSGYYSGKADEQRAELSRLLDEQDKVLAAAAANTPPGATLIGYAVYRRDAKQEGG